MCDVISDVLLHAEESCEATTKNKFYGDAGALYCLSSGDADVAFINAYNLSMILGKQQNIEHYTLSSKSLIGSYVPV
jgi:molybdate-binding protein